MAVKYDLGELNSAGWVRQNDGDVWRHPTGITLNVASGQFFDTTGKVIDPEIISQARPSASVFPTLSNISTTDFRTRSAADQQRLRDLETSTGIVGLLAATRSAFSSLDQGGFVDQLADLAPVAGLIVGGPLIGGLMSGMGAGAGLSSALGLGGAAAPAAGAAAAPAGGASTIAASEAGIYGTAATGAAAAAPAAGAAAGAGSTLSTIGTIANTVGTIGSLVTPLLTPRPDMPSEPAGADAARARGLEELARADAALNAARKRSQRGVYGARFFRTSALDRLGNAMFLTRPQRPLAGTTNPAGPNPIAPLNILTPRFGGPGGLLGKIAGR
jgi:hypothetical protein